MKDSVVIRRRYGGGVGGFEFGGVLFFDLVLVIRLNCLIIILIFFCMFCIIKNIVFLKVKKGIK